MDEANNPNDIGIEQILPGVLDKFDEQKHSLEEMKNEIGELKNDISRDNVKADVSKNLKDELKLFSTHIGNALASYGSDEVNNPSDPNLNQQIVT